MYKVNIPFISIYYVYDTFYRIQDFEYTPECIIFDLLGIPLYHGWLVDPQDTKTVEAVGNCSYNLLVEKIISDRSSEQPELVNQGKGTGDSGEGRE